jgi:hypothetical protein
MAKKAAIKRTTAKRKAKARQSKSRVKGAASPDRSQVQGGPSVAAKDLAALHASLNSTAKTADQRADASIVGLAQQHLEKGDHETVGSVLSKVSNWAVGKVSTFAQDHKEEFIHLAQHLALRAVRGG